MHWIDTATGSLHLTDVATAEGDSATRSWIVGAEIAALVLDAEVGTWAWVDGSLMRFDNEGRIIANAGAIPGLVYATTRANDAAWAPDGSLWIATMARDGVTELGSVVQYQPTSGFSTITTGLAIGNGPVFDRQRKVAYVADSVMRRVLRLCLTARTESEPFIILGDHEGNPDGMAVDHAGNVWVAHYGAARISVWSPAGVRLRTIDTPCSCPTAIDLDHRAHGVRAAVTSATVGTEVGGLWSLTMPSVV